MTTIILPGYSPSNKDWAEEAARQLTANGLPATVHYWEHWTAGSFSPKKEIAKILQEVGEGKINILAKSVGTGIASDIIAKIKNQIEKIILCGVPQINKERYQNFANFPGENIICFQNTKDPWAKYEEVRDFLAAINSKIKVISKEAPDHNYPYYKDFKQFLDQNKTVHKPV